MAKVVVGKFSEINGSKVRHVFDASGNLLGTVTKKEQGGYRIYRVKDGKVKEKRLLEDAYKAVARRN